MPPGITSTVGEPRALDREYNERRERIGRDAIRVIVQTQIVVGDQDSLKRLLHLAQNTPITTLIRTLENSAMWG